jgi:uncharacterized protein (TIRG00374 family)
MKWHLLVGILISAVFGLFVVYQIDFTQLKAALQSAHHVFLIIASLALLSTNLIRAWRWQYLLDPVKPIGILSLLSATCIGFMANMLLPAHAGEVVRAYVLGRKEQVSTMASLATIVVERVAALLSLLVFLVFVLIYATFPPEMTSVEAGLRMGGYIFAIVCLGLIGGLWLFKSKTAQTIRFVTRGLSFLPMQWREGLIQALRSFAVGLDAIKQGWNLVSIILLSLLLWLAVGLSNSLVFYAFDLQLPLFAAFFILVVQVVGVMIPSSPGYVGTYHAAVIAGLAVFEVTREMALSVAIMMHAAFFFPFILAGLFFLWGESFTFRELSSVKAQNVGD